MQHALLLYGVNTVFRTIVSAISPFLRCYLVHNFGSEPAEESEFKHSAKRVKYHSREHYSLRWHLYRDEELIYSHLTSHVVVFNLK
jgi:hypothetical protein